MIIVMLVLRWIIKKYYKDHEKKSNLEIVKNFCRVGVVFVIVWVVIALIAQLYMHSKIVGAYNRGKYQIVEGYVENFDPMPYSGHANESFEINGIAFSYSDYNKHPGYHNAKSHGGVIKGNGQHLKIGYVYLNKTYGNIIVYIEQISD